jgi:ribosome-associated toxin RatA of RatAB toxin-antitoxin module
MNEPTVALRAPFKLGPMPTGRALVTLDETIVHAPVQRVFNLVRDVERWPAHLGHYRYVRFRSRNRDGGGVVEMSANRPFGPINWPTWWLSQMAVDESAPNVRFRHIEGVTTGMDVEWAFTPHTDGTLVRLFHVWDGPDIPLIGSVAAVGIIGPVFVHGIATRTIAGLTAVAERPAS